MAKDDNDTEHKDADGAVASEVLYRWWFDALPNLLGGLAPPAAKKSARSAAGDRPALFPIDQATQGLALAQHWLGSLYESWLRALVAAPPGQQAEAAEEFVEDRVSGLVNGLLGIGQAFSGHPNLLELGSRLTGAPLSVFGEALKPLSLNMERAYGGLADAFGMAPLRELEAAWRDMALTSAAQRQAQVEYLEVVAGALRKGAEALMLRLAEMGRRGESVDSMLELVRLWARTTDAAMHDAMQSPRALDASAKLLRASARSRRQQQRVVAIASEALNVPTRAEVDEAYREIQELKRELRRMRKATAAPPSSASAIPSPTQRAARTPAARKTGRRKAANP